MKSKTIVKSSKTIAEAQRCNERDWIGQKFGIIMERAIGKNYIFLLTCILELFK